MSGLIHRLLIATLVWFSMLYVVYAQEPFTEEDQVYGVLDDIPAFVRLGTDPSNGAVRMEIVHPDIGVHLNALGYRRTDRMIYAVDEETQHLFRVDATGVAEDLGDIGLDPSLDYLSGDITPDGNTYILMGQANNADRRLLLIDLNSGSYAKSEIVMPGITHVRDFTIDFLAPNLLYGYDVINRTMVRFDLNTLGITALSEIAPDQDIHSCFVNAFGELMAFGTSNGGVAGALFGVERTTGMLDVVTTGAVERITDLAGIPYALGMRNTPSTRVAFPCNEIEYTYAVVNRTGSMQSSMQFETRIPPGLIFKGINGNPYGGSVSTASGILRISGMNIPQGAGSFKFRLEVGDTPPGFYYLQGRLTGMPPRFGTVTLSDDPITPHFTDSTRVRIDRIDQDSIEVGGFLCLGDSLVLDASIYGSNIRWYNGSTAPQFSITSAGQYSLQILGGCQKTVVLFNITAATCPFTIEVNHEMLPPQTLPCSEIIFRFEIDNDTGSKREGLAFTDTLPAGMTFMEIVNNPFGGELDHALLPQIIHISEMSAPVGRQVMDLRIAIADIPPGIYYNQAMLHNLPTELGPFRLSDDPRTPQHDRTGLEILGVETDTLIVYEILCPGTTLVLDGAPFGVNHQWHDGTHDATAVVTETGVYELVVFDGCKPTYIFFDVSAGNGVEVSFDSVSYNLKLGDTLLLSPQIYNSGSMLDVWWIEPLDSTMSCTRCAETLVFPTHTAEYWVYAVNEHCIDSALTVIRIDNARRLFVPNIFTPNADGVNDIVAMYSPDYGNVEMFRVIDRWGNVLYEKHNFFVNDESDAWNGDVNGRKAPAGAYLWHAHINFLDGHTESFAGTVCLIR